MKSLRRKKSKRKSKSKSKSNPLFDIKFLNKISNPYKNVLKTVVKKVKNKGIGVFACRDIYHGEDVCYYLVKAFDYKMFENKYNSVYTIELYTKSGLTIQKLIGDIADESLQVPTEDGMAFWGYMCNEPSKNQKSNTYLDINQSSNYLYRDKIKHGDLILYKLVATKDIKKGEEITWCYGSLYLRQYKTSCKDM